MVKKCYQAVLIYVHVVSLCSLSSCAMLFCNEPQQAKGMRFMQGLECKAVQALLKHPAFVEALHTLLKPYSRAVPALVTPIQELARKLTAAAGQLCFVQRCYTRLSFSDSRAVRAQSQSLVQVNFGTRGCTRQCFLGEGFPGYTSSVV